jgi:hypothetical protein
MNSLAGIVYTIFMIAILAVGVYAFVLFIKLAKRGIIALDIYINEKRNK